MIHLRQVVTKRKGSELRCAPFQSQLDSKLEGVGLEDLQPDMSSDNLVIKPGKPNSGIDAGKLLNCKTRGLIVILTITHAE